MYVYVNKLLCGNKKERFHTITCTSKSGHGPSFPWKVRVDCFPRYHVIVNLLLSFWKVFVVPPGDDHFPCSWIDSSNNFFKVSKSLVQIRRSPSSRRFSSSGQSRSIEYNSTVVFFKELLSELVETGPSAMLLSPRVRLHSGFAPFFRNKFPGLFQTSDWIFQDSKIQINPFVPKISMLILLTVCHTFHICYLS